VQPTALAVRDVRKPPRRHSKQCRMVAPRQTSFVATTVRASPESHRAARRRLSATLPSQASVRTFPRAEVIGIHLKAPSSASSAAASTFGILKLPSADMPRAIQLPPQQGNAQISPSLRNWARCPIDARASLKRASWSPPRPHDATRNRARAAIAHGAHHAVHVYMPCVPFHPATKRDRRGLTHARSHRRTDRRTACTWTKPLWHADASQRCQDCVILRKDGHPSANGKCRMGNSLWKLSGP